MQRLADLHRAVGQGLEVMGEELDATRRELADLNQQQCELEIALAKASAREKMEPKLQTACGGCHRFQQKLTAHRAELDRQFEALRNEMRAAAVELDRGRQEAQAAQFSDMSHERQVSEDARKQQAEKHMHAMEELQHHAQEGQIVLSRVAAQVAQMQGQVTTLHAGQRDLAAKYQNVGEACWKAVEDLKLVQQQTGAVKPHVQDVQERMTQKSVLVDQIRADLQDIRNVAAEASETREGVVPWAGERLQQSEEQIAALTEAFKSLEGKHNYLNEQMIQNQHQMDSLDRQVAEVESMVQIKNAN